MKIFVLIILVFCLFACQNISENNIYGKYSPISYKNTFDTITIKRGGIYDRVVYDKNGKKMLHYKSTYKLNQLSIEFSDFYFNLDNDLTVFPEDVKDLDMTFTTNFEKINDEITVCFGYHDGENCYKKVNLNK